MDGSGNGLGLAIKLARTRAKKTQRAVAEAVGLSTVYVSFIETGRKRPGAAALSRIALELGTTTKEVEDEAALLAGLDSRAQARRLFTEAAPGKKRMKKGRAEA